MSGPPAKSKRRHNRPSKSRSVTTSSTSQPAVEDTWSSTVLSAFAPDGQLFAFLSLAVDKHRLRVLDTNANQTISEHIVDGARVTSLAWSRCDVTAPVDSGFSTPSKKRKKVEDSRNASLPAEEQAELVVALGLSDGSIQLFSAIRGRILKSLTNAGNKSAVLAITTDIFHEKRGRCIWTSSADGFVRLWSLNSSECLLSMHEEGRPYTALAVRPGLSGNQAHLLAAHNSIRLLSFSVDSRSSNDSDSDKLDGVCTFGGCASAVKSLLWEPSSSLSSTFCSSAEDNRFIYLWQTSGTVSCKGNLIASLPLDANVVQMDMFSSAERRILLGLSSSGKVVLSPVPIELGVPTEQNGRVNWQISSLHPCTVMNLSKKASTDVRIANAAFLHNDPGKIRVALVSKGVKLSFETLEYLDNNGECISEIVLKPSISTFDFSKNTSDALIRSKRYTEPFGISVATGAETPDDPSIDAITEREAEGALDADLAELSLGQRLAARTDAVTGKRLSHEQQSSGYSVGNGVPDHQPEGARRIQIPAHSLTRTLIQALHAGDTSLLEACLTHSDETIIRNTVIRLPSQLSVPLLTACVERLGRGPRGNNIKGRGGGTSAQRGLSLMKWVRSVLIIHSGHLMTMPDLIARLSHLYSTLTTRLTLQDRLLSLSGRLDLILAQVELRSSNAPAPLASRKPKSRRRGKAVREPLKYMEGESSEGETEDHEEMQIEIEEDDQGSVEDIELGGSSEEESEGGSGGEEEDEDSNVIIGFVDDEAEEDYDEDASEEQSD